MRAALLFSLCVVMFGCGGTEAGSNTVSVTCSSGKKCVGSADVCAATCNASVPTGNSAENTAGEVTALGEVTVQCPNGGACTGEPADCRAFCGM